MIPHALPVQRRRRIRRAAALCGVLLSGWVGTVFALHALGVGRTGPMDWALLVCSLVLVIQSCILLWVV
jgi:hypothetical protein